MKQKIKWCSPIGLLNQYHIFNTRFRLSCLPCPFLLIFFTQSLAAKDSRLWKNIHWKYTENAAFIHKVPGAYRPHSSRFPKIYHYFCSLRAKDVVFKQSCSSSQPIRSQTLIDMLKGVRAVVVHLLVVRINMYYRERYAQKWSEICCGIHSFISINVIVSQFHNVCSTWKPWLTTNVQIN